MRLLRVLEPPNSKSCMVRRTLKHINQDCPTFQDTRPYKMLQENLQDGEKSNI